MVQVLPGPVGDQCVEEEAFAPAARPDRRRPGRPKHVSPELIPLLRFRAPPERLEALRTALERRDAALREAAEWETVIRRYRELKEELRL